MTNTIGVRLRTADDVKKEPHIVVDGRTMLCCPNFYTFNIDFVSFVKILSKVLAKILYHFVISL